MNAARLLEHFERIADAPDAIPRLRKFILDLAVRGKLVEQDPNDEPASELLKKIQAEKLRLAKTGEIKLPKSFSPVSASEVPFEIPAGWQWARIRQISTDRGQTIPIHDFTYIDVTSINKEQGCVSEAKVISASDAPSRARKVVCRGDVLYSCVRPYLLNVAIVEKDIVPKPIASTAFAIINGLGFVLPKFMWIVLRSPYMVACVENVMRGQAYPAINDSDFSVLPFPLSPLAEQYRIVAKVDELMALCDRLEASQAKRESRRDRLASASLKRIGQPEDVGNGEEFRENVRFHLQHLPRLATRPEHVKELRQTILNLAVRGKLVPQNPNDEPASELLKNICAEKLRLIKLKLIRNGKTLPAVSSSEEQFVVPMAWVWTRIGTCAAFTDYGTSCQTLDRDDGIPVLKMGDIKDGRVVLGYHKKVPATLDDLPSLILQKFDLLYNRTNSADLVGKTGIFLGEDGRFTFASYLIRIRFLLDFVSPVYVNCVMNSPYFRETQIVPELKQQCGQANVNGTKLRNMVIPLPPLAEQRRIVAKVDELMNLCDKLEVHLAANRTNQSRLLEATLCDALGVTCLPVSRSSRPAPSPTRMAAAHTEQLPRPITPRPGPVGTPTAAIQGSLIEQPTPQVGKPRAANGDVPGAILAQMQPGQEYSRAQLADALGLSVYEWNMAIRELKESGRVVQTGERRGARYSIN